MQLPYELATQFDLAYIDPNDIVVGRSFFYSDASPNVGKGPDAQALVEYDGNAVAGQIEMVIGTPLGSEEYEPTFGCNALKHLFDNNSLSSLELEILSALTTWLDDRLDFFSVKVSKEKNTGNVFVMVPFRIKATGSNLTYVGNLSNMASQIIN